MTFAWRKPLANQSTRIDPSLHEAPEGQRVESLVRRGVCECEVVMVDADSPLPRSRNNRLTSHCPVDQA
jgi:hypothetical protein